MLTSLSIHNIVLIDKAELIFPAPIHANLCILTGETGSGKSILLDALGLAIGFRSNLRLIGSGSSSDSEKAPEKAQVKAEFDISKNQNCQKILEENDLIDEENPNIIRIRRSISKNSGSKAFINDTSIGVNLLSKIGESLIEIHGQHDQRGLLNPSSHMGILDDFSNNHLLLKELSKTYEKIRSTENKIAELKAKKDQAERERDYLEHVVRELEDANIQENEEDELINKKDLLVGKEKILSFISELQANITEANSQLFTSQKILIRNQTIIDNFLPDYQAEFEKLSEQLDQQNSDLEAAMSNFGSIIHEVSHSEDSLDEIEERLLDIRTLARKFNVRVEELDTIIQDSQEKLRLLANEKEATSNLENELIALSKSYHQIADQIREKRQESALILAKKVEEELQFLKMEGTKFLINVTAIDDIQENTSDTPTKTKFYEKGLDKVEFKASINQNSFDNISKIASGGELSRFMLALKVALMNVRSVPTMIFDEIDTGIGGSTADAVGKRLKILAKDLQIFVVTHQPQIASKASTHFKISKSKQGDRVKTIIESLDENQRRTEIARMLSGEIISDEALEAAKMLIEK